MSRITAFLMLVCALLLVAPGANAQSAETPEYRDSITLGLAEFDEKNFLEARAQFSRAHAIYPNARTSRALGMVNFELKDYVQSVRFLQEALSSRERPLDADKREKTDGLLKRALGYVARYRLDLASETAVTVDGKPSQLHDGSELMLGVGEHVLEFRAADRITDKRTLNVQGGEQSTLRVRLLPNTASAQGRRPAETGESEPNRRPLYKNPWLWTAIGVVLAGAAAGTAIALTREPKTTPMKPDTGTTGIVLMGQSR
jgi:hypothetical protein